MIRRIGRPGLLGTMARTAVIAGTASAVNRGVNRAAESRARQKAEAEAYEAQQYQAQQYQPPPQQQAAPSGGGGDLTAKLRQLGELRDSGVLSDEEFAAAKAKLLS